MSNDKLPECQTRGFIFATTGELYTTLARRAARSLRQVHPDAEIDLFTDVTDLNDQIFSQIHLLSNDWFRPKMEALKRSRFEHTIYLDADIMVIAPVDTAFDLLNRFELVGCHDRFLNSAWVLEKHTRPLPHAFATVNAGVLGVRKNKRTQRFLDDWTAAIKTSGATKDQPALRELLFDSDIVLGILPPQYNFMKFNELKGWWGFFGAPRILHSPFLHKTRKGPGDPETPYSIAELAGPLNAYIIRALMQADVTITPHLPLSKRRMNSPFEPAPVRWLRSRLAPAYHKLRKR